MYARLFQFVVMASLLGGPNLRAAKPLSILLEKWPGSIHPVNTITLEGILILNQVYETLVSAGPSSQIVPNLLESWNYDKNLQQFTFTLKKGIKFSNGVVLESKHIQTMMERIIAAKTFRNFDKIKGAKAFRDGKRKTIEGFSVVDDRHFKIRFDFFYPKFLEELADPYATVFLEGKSHRFPLGTGPYQVADVSEAQGIVSLIKNPTYDRSRVAFDGANFFVKNTGEIDIAFVPPRLKSGETPQAARKMEYFDTEVHYLAFNAAHPNLKDKEVRRSLASLLTPELVDETLGSVRYPIGGIVPLGLVGHDPTLAVAAPKTFVKPKRPVLVYSYLSRIHPLAEKYCEVLRKKGIACTFKKIDPDEMIKSKASNTLQLLFLRQKSTNYSPEYLLSGFVPSSVVNFYTVGKKGDRLSSEMESLFDRIQEVPASEPRELMDSYRRMDRAILAECLAKPFRYGADKEIYYSKRIKMPKLDTLGPFGLKLNEVEAN